MKKLFTYIPYIFFILASIPLILPYFHAGYFPTHDGLWAVVRLGDMFRELKDHQFPARYSGNLNFGYGYPLFNFAYPFPYYLGIVFHLLHLSFINTIKLMFALTVIVSGIGMYVASSALWKNKAAGWISGILYLYLPYRMVDLYVRGSIGESFAFALFPFLVLSVIKMTQNPLSKRWMTVGGLLLAMLITSHNIMAILFTPVIVTLAFVMGWGKKKTLFTLLQSLLLGICLSAFFWLPALVEKNFILLSRVPIADRNLYFVSVQQLLFPSWNYGIPGGANGFTYQIGLPAIATFLLVAALFLQRRNKILLTLCISILVMIAMLFSWSNFLWQHTPLLREINYPWTLLGPIGFWISLVSGYLVAIKKKWIYTYLGICIAGAILLVIPYARPEKYIYPDDNYFLTNDATTTSSTEYIPLWVKKWPVQRADQKVVPDKGVVSSVRYSSKQTTFAVQSDSSTKVTINTIYYPGWIAKVDNTPATISYDNPMGLMQIAVAVGSHTVSMKFTETPLRAAADAVSLASVFFAVSYFLISFIPEKKKRP